MLALINREERSCIPILSLAIQFSTGVVIGGGRKIFHLPTRRRPSACRHEGVKETTPLVLEGGSLGRGQPWLLSAPQQEGNVLWVLHTGVEDYWDPL